MPNCAAASATRGSPASTSASRSSGWSPQPQLPTSASSTRSDRPPDESRRTPISERRQPSNRLEDVVRVARPGERQGNSERNREEREDDPDRGAADHQLHLVARTAPAEMHQRVFAM